MVWTLLSTHCLSQTDSVCFSIEDAKTIYKLANKGRWCDSLSINYEIQIEGLSEIVERKNSQLALAGELIAKQSIMIADLNAKLSESERKRLNLKRGCIALLGVIGVETLFLILK